jgi:Mn-dependent DtxR family transcriptional regulator
MTPFEEVLARTIVRTKRDLVRDTAPTQAIAARLPMSVPPRSLRYYLNKLEKKGFLGRPLGPKRGWTLTGIATAA